VSLRQITLKDFFMTKREISLKIAAETGLGKTQTKLIVQAILDGMLETIVTEGRLELRNFGVFEVRTRKARQARNPRTGEIFPVPEQKVVSFKPGMLMQNRIAPAALPADA
jgi:nucleoid DNA-binding protein